MTTRPSQSSNAAMVSRMPSELDRRRFLATTAAALAAAGCTWTLRADEAKPKPAKIIVGADPWVYAATQPKYDIYPILDRIFADMRYAGLDGIELMHSRVVCRRCGRADQGVVGRASVAGDRHLVRRRPVGQQADQRGAGECGNGD